MSQKKAPFESIEQLDAEVRRFPCKCDHCPWTGTVNDTKLVKGQAKCPQCGGSLAANRPQDQLADMVADLFETNPDGW